MFYAQSTGAAVSGRLDRRAERKTDALPSSWREALALGSAVHPRGDHSTFTGLLDISLSHAYTQPNLAPSIFSLAWQNANKNKGGLKKEVKTRLITAVQVADIRLIGQLPLRHGWRLWAPFSRSALTGLSLIARDFQIDISVFLPVRFSFSFPVLGEMISVATLTVCCRSWLLFKEVIVYIWWQRRVCFWMDTIHVIVIRFTFINVLRENRVALVYLVTTSMARTALYPVQVTVMFSPLTIKIQWGNSKKKKKKTVLYCAKHEICLR